MAASKWRIWSSGIRVEGQEGAVKCRLSPGDMVRGIVLELGGGVLPTATTVSLAMAAISSTVPSVMPGGTSDSDVVLAAAPCRSPRARGQLPAQLERADARERLLVEQRRRQERDVERLRRGAASQQDRADEHPPHRRDRSTTGAPVSSGGGVRDRRSASRRRRGGRAWRSAPPTRSRPCARPSRS